MNNTGLFILSCRRIILEVIITYIREISSFIFSSLVLLDFSTADNMTFGLIPGEGVRSSTLEAGN